MGRLAFRYTLRGTLTAETALNVAGLGPDGTVDLGQVRDGMGRVVIPGTSLAGVIRAALPTVDETWWGTHLTESGEDAKARASRVTVSDSPAMSADVALEVRDGVSIDRITGAAASQHLFSRAVVPAGTEFRFHLDVEVPSAADDSEALTLTTQIASLLRGPGITVGAAGTRGLGRVRLSNASVKHEDFTSQEGLLEALRDGGSAVNLAEVLPDTVPPGVLRVTVPWQPLGAVMSRVAEEGSYSDAFPAVTTDSAGIRLVIYGSSLKGTLRSHAERILRTLRGQHLDTHDFTEQMAQSAALPGIGEIFGAAGNLAAGEPGMRGLLTVRDVTSSQTLPADEWAAVRSGGIDQANPPQGNGDDNDRRRRALATAVRRLNEKAAAEGLWFDIASRNAIDRWTGAAADGLLFTTVEPHSVGERAARAWTPMVLDLDVSRARRRGTSVDALIALLIFLVRDFAEGWIPIGFGTTRGLGSVRGDLASVQFEFAGNRVDTDVAGLVTGKSLVDVLADAQLTERIDTAWKDVACQTQPAG